MHDDEIHQLAALQHNVFSTADARTCGHNTRTIQRAVAAGTWVRIRRGYYVLAERWTLAVPTERHLLVARAVVRDTPSPVAVTHTTGTLALGAEMWNPNLKQIHLTRIDGTPGGFENGVTHHVSPIRDDSLVRIDDDFVVADPTATILGAMMLHSLDQAVVVGDSAGRLQIVDVTELAELAERLQRVPNTRHVRLAARLVDAKAGSVGESLSRQMFWRGRLPRPTLQYEVNGPAGELAYTDFGWEEERVVGEFDGKIKYQRLMRAGESASDVVVREKQREQWIVETGVTMRRLVWKEIFTPAVTVARFRRALESGRRHIS